MNKTILLSLILPLLFIGCRERPSSFVENNPNWIVIPISKNLEKDTAWGKLSDMLAKNYDLEVLNKDSGYIRSAWKNVVEVVDDGKIKDAYRKRVTVKIISDTHVLEMKSEAQWWAGKYWVNGFDQTDLNTIKTDISAIIGDAR